MTMPMTMTMTLTYFACALAPKGTYLWGPDELDNMAVLGNALAETTYGGRHARPPNDASDALWRQFLIDKYERRMFSPKVPTKVHDQRTNAVTDKMISRHLRVPANVESKPKSPKTKNKLTKNYMTAPSPVINHGVTVDNLLDFDFDGYQSAREISSKNDLEWKESTIEAEIEANTKNESQAQTDGTNANVAEQDFFAQFGVH